jgi:hypothetical protein
MQQRASWKPVIIANVRVQSSSQWKISGEEDVVGPSSPAFDFTHADGLPLQDAKLRNRRSDLGFSVAVSLAFILPAFIGLGLYAAVHSIILMAS